MSDRDRVEDAITGARLTSTGYYQVQCVFCLDEGHDDKKTSLHVNAATGWYKCWRCEARGRISPQDAPGRVLPPPTQGRPDKTLFEAPEGFQELETPIGRSSLTFEPAWAYLIGRGIHQRAIQALRLGACEGGFWGGRIIAPHFDVDGKTWLGWVGRVWVKRPREGVLPYRYPVGMQRTLYNARVLEIETDEPALGFEGALDVAHYHDRAFGFFGSPTPAHLKEIKERAKRPVAIVLDGDAHDKGAMVALHLRLDGIEAGSVRLGPRIDPDQVDRN